MDSVNVSDYRKSDDVLSQPHLENCIFSKRTRPVKRKGQERERSKSKDGVSLENFQPHQEGEGRMPRAIAQIF